MGLKQTYGARFSSAREYMTPVELQLFRDLRETGEVSFFQTSSCKICDSEIPKSKKFCSLQCMEVDNDAGEMD